MAARWMDRRGPWILEGVTMVRALRKWLRRHPQGVPADLVIWLGAPAARRKRGQRTMALGAHTIWRQIEPELSARGTMILEMNG